MMKRLIFMIQLLLAGGACRTAHEQNYELKSVQNSSPETNLCTGEAIKCDQSEPESPTMCTATVYDGNILPKRDYLMGWGRTPCRARASMKVMACRNNKDPGKLSGINCVPDPSDQECPPAEASCPDINEPTVCTATTYIGDKLDWKQAPKAWAKNRCEAQARLNWLACRLNLKPSGLGDVLCEEDFTQGECPVLLSECAKEPDSKPYICRTFKIGGVELSDPIVVYGNSECESKAGVFAMVCQYANSANRLKPSMISDIDCYPEID